MRSIVPGSKLASAMASANTLSNNEGGASAVDIASSVGTWGAASLAMIALVGIVAPFITL